MNVEIKSKCLRDNSSNRNMDEEWEKQIKNWKETKEKKKRNKAKEWQKDNVLGCIKNESEKQKKKNLKRKSETRRMEKSLIKKARI